jgi:hypothetical protein
LLYATTPAPSTNSATTPRMIFLIGLPHKIAED